MPSASIEESVRAPVACLSRMTTQMASRRRRVVHASLQGRAHGAVQHSVKKGPDDGSKVTFCSSQCEELVCPGSPGCAVAPVQTAFDLQTVRKLGPGVGKASAPASEMISAPEGLPLNAAPPQIPTVNPLWTTTLPKRYVPVIMYRRPEDVAATSVAPPTWNPEWFAWPTLSPVAADMGASVSGQTGQMSLVSTRLRGKPHDPIAPDQP